MQVPSFIARRFYVTSSLRNTATGFSLEAQNPMGSGTLVGVRALSVDGRPIPLEAVSAVRQGESEPIRATDLSRLHPIKVALGDRVTLAVTGDRLATGEHKLEVELDELNLGALRLSISDRVTEA
ncbi:MAG: hypothetical protein ACHQ15_03750 [Candidatus Limnocylindrales bacterium]